MTLATLKRHMDRRFDRLQRTKADKTDLQRFATKKDLRRFATKADLRRFATKEDLQRFATKEDLQRFATKDDLLPLNQGLTEVLRKLDSLHEKIASLARIGDQRNDAHDRTLSEHERRLQDLEARAIG